MRCKFPSSFDHSKIIKLCTNRYGKEANYQHLDLKQLDLAGVELAHADFSKTNLSGTNLRKANLEHANLTEVQALGTDFSEASLTGACIQNWGINSDTKFTNVHCDYIYLEQDQKERKPASGSFQPGDFEKLVDQFTKTLDFLFRNGIEPQAFDIALNNLRTDYEQMDLRIQSVVDLGNGDKLVRLDGEIPESAKAEMHKGFSTDYQSLLKQLESSRKEQTLLQQTNASLETKLAVTEARLEERVSSSSLLEFLGRPTPTKIEIMQDQSSNKSTVGDINAPIGVFSGRDSEIKNSEISVTKTINQLQDSKDPKATELADLLKQLKTAIAQKESGLSEQDQTKALKHIDALAKLGSDRQNPDLLEKAGDALDALPTILNRGAGLVEFAEKHLPTITVGIKGILAVWGVTL
ncbi:MULTISPECIES: pentapeptide repeat-containing protein [unclassified Phormidesmis]